MTDQVHSRSSIRQVALAVTVGALTGTALLCLLSFLGAAALMLVTDHDRMSALSALALVLLLPAGLVAGRLTASLCSVRGWLCGLLASVGMMVMLRLLALPVNGGSLFSGWALAVWAVLCLAAVVGGVVGANKR